MGQCRKCKKEVGFETGYRFRDEAAYREFRIKVIRDWVVAHRPTTCAAEGCPVEGLEYRENYDAYHVLSLQEDEGAPYTEIEARAHVYDDDEAPKQVEIFCPSCGEKVVFAPEDVPYEVLDTAVAFKNSLKEEPNG